MNEKQSIKRHSKNFVKLNTADYILLHVQQQFTSADLSIYSSIHSTKARHGHFSILSGQHRKCSYTLRNYLKCFVKLSSFKLLLGRFYHSSQKSNSDSALSEITSGPEVQKIFKIGTVPKPDVYLPRPWTFNTYRNRKKTLLFFNLFSRRPMFRNISPDLVQSGRTCPANLGVPSGNSYAPSG